MKYAIIEIDGEYYPARLVGEEYEFFKYGPFKLLILSFEFRREAREFIEAFHKASDQLVIEEIGPLTSRATEHFLDEIRKFKNEVKENE